jgi:integrase
MWSVPFYDAAGARRRLRCASREEADYERARLVLAESRGEAVAPPSTVTVEDSRLTLAEFWPMYRSDAQGRLARSTLREYERLWMRRLESRFGHLALEAIRPRMVSEWRAELLAAGVGAEAVRYAMVLLQAMFTLAIEWGEAQANPVAVVRKPRQGRQRAIEPLTPENIERLRSVLLDGGDHPSATLVSVLAYAGLRPFEALGLEWRHVRDRTLLIEQAVSDGHLKRQKTNRI